MPVKAGKISQPDVVVIPKSIGLGDREGKENELVTPKSELTVDPGWFPKKESDEKSESVPVKNPKGVSDLDLSVSAGLRARKPALTERSKSDTPLGFLTGTDSDFSSDSFLGNHPGSTVSSDLGVTNSFSFPSRSPSPIDFGITTTSGCEIFPAFTGTPTSIISCNPRLE